MSEGLSTVGLDELVELRPEKVASNKDPNLPYIGLEHIAQGQPRLLGTLPSSASVSINCYFSKDDILFGKLRPNLRKSLKAPFAGYCSTDIIVLRALDGVLPKYAAHVFQWERVFAAASTTAVGTKMPRTSWNELRRYRVFKTNSNIEQSRIAAVLDTVDEAIAKTEAVIAKLRQVRAGLLHDLLTRGLDANGQLRDPITHPEQFQDSPLGFIPNDWEVTSLGEALSMQAGDALTSENISDMGTYPVYGGNGVRGFTTRYTHNGCYAIIGRQGALCGNIVLASGKFFATEHAVVCTPVKKISAGWLACYLSRMNLNRFSESSAQPGLSVQKISHQQIALPKMEEQIAIESRLDAADESLNAEEIEIVKIKQLKSGLMTDLLTGRVRVPEDGKGTK